LYVAIEIKPHRLGRAIERLSPFAGSLSDDIFRSPLHKKITDISQISTRMNKNPGSMAFRGGHERVTLQFVKPLC
jgi:hypothetical protein